eukprot:962672-Rhodomonas_salina.2
MAIINGRNLLAFIALVASKLGQCDDDPARSGSPQLILTSPLDNSFSPVPLSIAFHLTNEVTEDHSILLHINGHEVGRYPPQPTAFKIDAEFSIPPTAHTVELSLVDASDNVVDNVHSTVWIDANATAEVQRIVTERNRIEEASQRFREDSSFRMAIVFGCAANAQSDDTVAEANRVHAAWLNASFFRPSREGGGDPARALVELLHSHHTVLVLDDRSTLHAASPRGFGDLARLWAGEHAVRAANERRWVAWTKRRAVAVVGYAAGGEHAWLLLRGGLQSAHVLMRALTEDSASDASSSSGGGGGRCDVMELAARVVGGWDVSLRER